jgi:hypothetical protein
MKKVSIFALIILTIACSKDDPDPYPKPIGCTAVGVQCNDGTSSQKNDPSICANQGGFKEWICK